MRRSPDTSPSSPRFPSTGSAVPRRFSNGSGSRAGAATSTRASCTRATSTRTSSACRPRRSPVWTSASEIGVSSSPRTSRAVSLPASGWRTRPPMPSSPTRRRPPRNCAREGVPAAKIRTISNGVDCATFAPARPPGRPIRRVVTVANLRPEKGHDTLICGRGARDWSTTRHRVPRGRRRTVGRIAEARGRTRGLGPRCSSWASGPMSLPCSRRAISSCCPHDPKPARTACSRPWPRDCPSWRLASAGCPSSSRAESTVCWSSPIDRRSLPRPSSTSSAVRSSRQRSVAQRARKPNGSYSFDRMVSGFEHLYLSELGRRAVASEHDHELAAS